MFNKPIGILLGGLGRHILAALELEEQEHLCELLPLLLGSPGLQVVDYADYVSHSGFLSGRDYSVRIDLFRPELLEKHLFLLKVVLYVHFHHDQRVIDQSVLFEKFGVLYKDLFECMRLLEVNVQPFLDPEEIKIFHSFIHLFPNLLGFLQHSPVEFGSFKVIGSSDELLVASRKVLHHV